MIKYIKGNIFKTNAAAIVNPVNTQGVMGKGLALEFKKRYPENYKSYKKACHKNLCKIGKIHTFKLQNNDSNLKYIMNFPTKHYWNNPSELEYIVKGLYDVQMEILWLGLGSIAIPRLGCGLGGLDWKDVLKCIEDILGILDELEVQLYSL